MRIAQACLRRHLRIVCTTPLHQRCRKFGPYLGAPPALVFTSDRDLRRTASFADLKQELPP